MISLAYLICNIIENYRLRCIILGRMHVGNWMKQKKKQPIFYAVVFNNFCFLPKWRKSSNFNANAIMTIQFDSLDNKKRDVLHLLYYRFRWMKWNKAEQSQIMRVFWHWSSSSSIWYSNFQYHFQTEQVVIVIFCDEVDFFECVFFLVFLFLVSGSLILAQ